MPGEGLSVSSKEPIKVRPPGHARYTRMRPSSKMTSANTANSFPKSPWPTREQKAPLSGIQDCCASESWPPPPWVSFTSLSVSHPIWNLRGRCNPVFRLGSCRKCENTDCAKDGGEERGLHFLERPYGCRLSPAERFGSFVYGLKSGAFGVKSWAIATTQGHGDLSNIHYYQE